MDPIYKISILSSKYKIAHSLIIIHHMMDYQITIILYRQIIVKHEYNILNKKD